MTFDEHDQNLVLGNIFHICDAGGARNTSGIINSIFITITNQIKYDMDLLFFNQSLTSTVENCKPLILTQSDALNCFGKIRIEGNNDGNMDDFLNIVGGYYFAHLFNINLPYSGKEIFGVAVYQDVNTHIFDNNTFLTINHDNRGNSL